MDVDIDDVVRRLTRLVNNGPKGKYHLGQPITADALARFEEAHGVTLPGEYRAFLLAVGEAPSGPVYGLLSLPAAIAERGDGIYGLADPFPAPLSTLDHLDFNVGGILPISYDGCAYFHGLIVTGRERGQVWFSLEERPGWVPVSSGTLVGRDGKPVKSFDDYAAMYDASLDPRNEGTRIGFAAWYASWLENQEKALGGGSA